MDILDESPSPQFFARDISQSWMHMVLYYYAIRFDAAVGILREFPRDQWPKYWHENLGKELDIATWFLSSYAARQTVPPPVAFCWSDLIHEGGSEDSMELTIRSTHSLDWDLFKKLRIILPEWSHQHSRPTFGMDNPWWAIDDSEFHHTDQCNKPDWVLYRARKYFNDCWPESPSPLDENHNIQFDEFGVKVTAELEVNLNELWAVEEEMRDAWRRVDLLRQ